MQGSVLRHVLGAYVIMEWGNDSATVPGGARSGLSGGGEEACLTLDRVNPPVNSV